MFKGPWELTCTEDMEVNDRLAFVKGQTYRVKDKFPGDDGTVETGVWEMVSDGRLIDVSLEQRERHFSA